MRPLARWSVAAYVLTLSACALPSLAEYSAGSTRDGGGVTFDEGGTGDGGAEGGSRRRPDGGGDDGPLCATLAAPVLLCADFEDGALPGPFDSVASERGGSVAIDATVGAGGTSSLLSRVQATGSSTAAACLVRNLTGPYKRIELDFDVRVDATGRETYDVVKFNPTGIEEIGLEARPTGAVEVDEDRPTPDGGEPIAKVTLNARLQSSWTHVHWRMDRENGAVQSVLEIGGVKTEFVSQSDLLGSTLRFELGDCTYGDAQGTWQVRFDNVVLDADD